MGKTADARDIKALNEVRGSLNSNPDRLIDWFDDLGSGNEKFNFLSNFYRGAPLVIPGLTLGGSEVQFITGEHMFAAFKARNEEIFLQIATAEDQPYSYTKKDGTLVEGIEEAPAVAKHLGRTVNLRVDWDDVRLDVMALVLRTKFTHQREEGQRLLDTGDAYLEEGTWWGDEVWGVALDKPGRPGRNWLGTLLMARRAELRAGTGYPNRVGLANLMYAGFNWM